MSVFVSLFLLILSCEVRHIDDSICKIIVFVLIFIICLISPLLIVNKNTNLDYIKPQENYQHVSDH